MKALIFVEASNRTFYIIFCCIHCGILFVCIWVLGLRDDLILLPTKVNIFMAFFPEFVEGRYCKISFLRIPTELLDIYYIHIYYYQYNTMKTLKSLEGSTRTLYIIFFCFIHCEMLFFSIWVLSLWGDLTLLQTKVDIFMPFFSRIRRRTLLSTGGLIHCYRCFTSTITKEYQENIYIYINCETSKKGKQTIAKSAGK